MAAIKKHTESTLFNKRSHNLYNCCNLPRSPRQNRPARRLPWRVEVPTVISDLGQHKQQQDRSDLCSCHLFLTMIPNRFTLILISLTSSLIDAAHTSSEIASPRSRPTFTLGDEDLCDFLYPCTPHAIRPRPLRPPLDGAYGSTFFNRWPGLLLLCVACLLLGVVIGTVCPAWETRAQRATRASPLVDAHSSEINLTQVPVVDENSPQEAREAASTGKRLFFVSK